jgi:small subunit ribosomal protein S6
MRQYEVMLILPPESEEGAGAAVVDRIGQVLGDQGEVGKVDRWGRRRLAFPIARQSEGYYVVAEFKADPGAIAELDRTLQLADDVLRFKVVLRAA